MARGSGRVDRRVLYDPEVRRIEQKLGRSLREISLKQMVQIDQSLVSAKVLDTVLVGAEENAVWREIANVKEMSTPQLEVPTITENDFKVVKGMTGAAVRSAGGRFATVSLDCSDDSNTLYRANVGIRKSWIRDQNWQAVEEALAAAGRAFYYDVTKKVCSELISDAGQTDTLANLDAGGDHYKAIVAAIGKVRKKGFNPDTVVVNPDEEADLMKLDKFIDIEMLDREGSVVRTGQIGKIYSNVNVFSTNAMTAGTIIVVSKQKGEVVGVRQDLEFEDYDDPITGLEGSYASGNDSFLQL